MASGSNGSSSNFVSEILLALGIEPFQEDQWKEESALLEVSLYSKSPDVISWLEQIVLNYKDSDTVFSLLECLEREVFKEHPDMVATLTSSAMCHPNEDVRCKAIEIIQAF